MNSPISKTKADLGLLSVTVFWGSTFILSKQVLEDVPLHLFLAIRLTIAAFAMLIITVILRRIWTKQAVKHGLILGILLYLSYLFQMWGIQYTTASNAGFITGLSVVFVPVFSIFIFRAILKINVITGVLLATVGLLFLSGGNPLHWNRGDFLVLICALNVTFHVILTSRFSRLNDIFVLTSVQLGTISLLSIFIFLILNIPFRLPDLNDSLTLVYLACFGTVYTFLMQTAMQRYTTATRTALVFSMEPVFAAVFAFFIAGELLPATGMLGGFLIVGGMLSAEIDWNAYFCRARNNSLSK